MKKLFTLFAAALVMLAAASCEKNEVLPGNNSEGKVVTLKATINNGETKTSLGGLENGEYPVLWSAGDAIAVIQTKNVEIEGEENTITKIFKFVLQGEGGTTNGVFNLVEYDECGYTVEEFDASAEVKAFYPFEWVVSGAKCNIPTTQTYAENSFGNGASPMAAYRAADNNGALDFQNLFGALKLQIKGMEGEKVQSIEIRSSFNIAGEASFDLEETEGGVQEFVLRVASLDGTSCVTLDCENDNGGVLIQELTNFLIALHPDANWLRIRIKTNEAVYYRTIDRETIITAGTILKMAELENMAPAYIDENDNYLGDGIALPAGEGKTIIWAPVNCGYEPANGSYKGYPYGKMYQWGRKDGQGYSDEYDASVPVISNEEVPATLDPNTFYTNWYPTYTEWPAVNNPCPAGWRVPTLTEMQSLSSGFTSENYYPEPSDQNKESFEQEKGYYFYGVTDSESGDNKVFFPAAGSLNVNGSCGIIYELNDYDYTYNEHKDRKLAGHYWTTTTDDDNSWYFRLGKDCDEGIWGDRLFMATHSRVIGRSVRCVKE